MAILHRQPVSKFEHAFLSALFLAFQVFLILSSRPLRPHKPELQSTFVPNLSNYISLLLLVYRFDLPITPQPGLPPSAIYLPQPVIFLFSIFFCLFNSELLTTNRPSRYHCSFSLVSQDPVDTCLLLGPSLLLSKVIAFRCVACRPCVTRSVCRLSTKGRTDDHFFPIQSPPLALYLRCSIFILITLGPARSSLACIHSLYTSHCLTYSQATKPGLPTCRSLFAIACYKGQQLR